MPPRPAPIEVPTWDFTGRRPRLVPPAPATWIETEPSPLLEAIRMYLDKVS
jgi:hypothetical protein